MANGKKSVLLYCDIYHTVKELSDCEAGVLFKHYLEYINDLNPTPPDKLTQIVFEPIKQNLKRDLQKWESKSLKNRDIANMRWQKENANASERINSNANHADKDKVTVTVNDKVKDNDKDKDKDIINNKFSFKNSLLVLGASENLINDWLLVRKNKKATNSETAFNSFKKELELSGLEINNVLTICIERSWSGFKSEWVKNTTKQTEQKQSLLTPIIESRNRAHELIDLKYGKSDSNNQ